MIAAILAGVLGVLAAIGVAFAKGRSGAKSEAKAAQDRATIDTRTRIDEAVTHAPTDAVAARAALAKRVHDSEHK